MVFIDSGKAITDNSLHVTLENADFELTSSRLGNVFIVDSDHKCAKLDSNTMSFIWLNEKLWKSHSTHN